MLKSIFCLLLLFVVIVGVNGHAWYPSRNLESAVRFKPKPDIKRISDYEEYDDDENDSLVQDQTPIPPISFDKIEEGDCGLPENAPGPVPVCP